MSTINPPPSGQPKTGGPGTALVEGRLFDLAGSLHDSSRDLTLPVLPPRQWYEIRFSADLIDALVTTQAYLLTRVARKADENDKTAAARQRAPSTEVDFLEKLFDERPRDPRKIAENLLDIAREIQKSLPAFRDNVEKQFRTNRRTNEAPRKKDSPPLLEALTTSAAVARFINCAFLDPRLPRKVDLRTGWFGIRDQRKSAGCVGWAVADALWRQRGQRLDIPSARFIWQAAKEIDGEQRPTTMIAGAGTSVRAGLNVVREYGYALEAELPSQANTPYNGSIETFYSVIGARRIENFVHLGNDLKNRLTWLSLRRPIVCTIAAGRRFMDARGERLQARDGSEDESVQDDDFSHAVLIVGYRVSCDPQESVSDTVTRFVANEANGKKTSLPKLEDLPVEYLIRNSAGRNWGDRGYVWVKHAEIYQSIMEEYGVFSSENELNTTQLKPDDYRRKIDELLGKQGTGRDPNAPPTPMR